MRSLRKSAMELGETRQLVIPCQRCGESRVIRAKQGCHSNALPMQRRSKTNVLFPGALVYACKFPTIYLIAIESDRRFEWFMSQVRREVIESNPMFAEFLQQSSPTAAPAGSVSIRRRTSS